MVVKKVIQTMHFNRNTINIKAMEYFVLITPTSLAYADQVSNLKRNGSNSNTQIRANTHFLQHAQ